MSNPEIICYMVVRNPHLKRELFLQSVKKSSELCDFLYIVNHASDRDAESVFSEALWFFEFSSLQKESDGGITMDEVKWKWFLEIKKQFWDTGKYLLILDWDEILSDELIQEIKNTLLSQNTAEVFYIPRTTFCLDTVIDRGTMLPLLSKIWSVSIGAFQKVHDLYRVHSAHAFYFTSPLLHYSFSDISELFSKHSYYARAEAINLYTNKPNITSFWVFIRAFWEGFIYASYTLLKYKNYTNRVGWLYCGSYFSYKFQKYFFYTELQKNHGR